MGLWKMTTKEVAQTKWTLNVIKWKNTINNGHYMRSETDLFIVKSYFPIGWSYNHIHHYVNIIKKFNHFVLNLSTILFEEGQHFVWMGR